MLGHVLIEKRFTHGVLLSCSLPSDACTGRDGVSMFAIMPASTEGGGSRMNSRNGFGRTGGIANDPDAVGVPSCMRSDPNPDPGWDPEPGSAPDPFPFADPDPFADPGEE